MPEIQARTPDGVIHRFPDGTPPEAVQKAIKSYLATQNSQQNQPTPATQEGSISAVQPDFISRAVQGLRSLLPASSTSFINSLPQNASKQEFLAKSAPVIEAGAGAAATGLATTFGAPAGIAALAGSAAMPAANQIIRNYLGQPPGQSVAGFNYQTPIGPILEGTALNELGGRFIGGLKANIGGILPKVVSPELNELGYTTGQALGKDTKIGEAANFLEDIYARQAKKASIAESGAAAVGQIAEKTKEADPINAPPGLIDKLLKDTRSLGRFLRNGEVIIDSQPIVSDNARRDLQGYLMNKIFYDNAKLLDPTDLTKVSLDGQGMLTDFANFVKTQQPNLKLFNNVDTTNFTEFLKAVQSSTDIGHSIGPYYNLNLITKTLGVGGAILAGHYGGAQLGAEVLGGYMSLAVTARMLASRTAAPVFLNMLKGAPLGMSLQAASRIIVNSIARQPITLVTSDGKHHEGIMGADGQFKPNP